MNLLLLLEADIDGVFPASIMNLLDLGANADWTAAVGAGANFAEKDFEPFKLMLMLT